MYTNLFVLIKLYFEIIIESHAILRSNMWKCHVPCNQYSPMITACKIIVCYHHQEIGIDNNSQISFRFPSFTDLCVCAGVFVHVCARMCVHFFPGNLFRV